MYMVLRDILTGAVETRISNLWKQQTKINEIEGKELLEVSKKKILHKNLQNIHILFEQH